MSDTQSSTENRHHQRILFKTPVHIIINGETIESTALDISFKGALVARPDNWTAKHGDSGLLRIELSSNETTIEMEVEVAHSEKESIGFHCNHIDIDSITHLRRLVELNLGDEEMLNRELAHLND